MVQTKRIRVMILINTLLHGGAERMVVDIADKIDKKVFDLHVVYMKSHEHFKGGKKSFLPDVEKAGVRVTCLNGKHRSALKESWALWKLLQKERPDILHTFLPYAGTIGRIIGRLAGVSSIVAVQCNLKMAYSKKVYFLDLFTLFLATVWTGTAVAIEEEYVGESMSYSDQAWKNGRRHFTVVSGVDVEDIQREVVATDRDAKRHEVGIREGSAVVTMTARLISWKGHEDLIDAFAVLPANTELLLIGGGPKLEKLQERARKLGVIDRIHFLGNRGDLFSLMAISDVYVQSYSRAGDGSLWKGPNTSQMVAAAAGVPAVSTQVPLIETFMMDGESGKLAEVNNPQSLAASISSLLEDRVGAQRMAAQAFDMVRKKYSLAAMVKAYEDMYKKLLE